MIALDTNILARYLLQDDTEQAEQAACILESGETLFVTATVILELAWVLKTKGRSKAEIIRGLDYLHGLPRMVWQESDALDYALKLATAGLDMADALHLALSKGCDSLQTFDANFAARAQRENARPAVNCI